MTSARVGNRKTLVVAVLVAAAAALVVTMLHVRGAGPSAAVAADHLDAPGLAPPPGGDGIGTDITDLYTFQSSANAKNTVLIMNVNGLMTGDLADPPGADRPFAQAIPKVKVTSPVYYNFRVDTSHPADAIADVDIQVAFGKTAADGSQDMRVKVLGSDKEIELEGRSTGFGQAPVVNHGPKGITAFAGRRDDPFFFDLLGFLAGAGPFIGCTTARDDTFAGQNVSSIVIELPSKLLTGGGSAFGVWATTNVGESQIDRMGRPAIATVFIPNNPFEPVGSEDSLKNTYNHAEPVNDQAAFRAEVVDSLTLLYSLNDAQSGEPVGDAAAIQGLADFLLPDILTIDLAVAPGFPNGRRPADDVIDVELGLVTDGLITSDCVGSNDVSFPSAFPYLAAPHPTS